VRGRIHHNRRAPARVLTGGRKSLLRVSGRWLDRRNRGPAWRPRRAAARKSDDLLVPVAQVRLITGRPASVNANWAPSRVGAEGLRWKNACGGWSKRAKAFEPPKTRTRRCNTLDQSFHMLASASLHALLAWASPSAIKSTSNMLQSKGRITLKR
jgi:hypothetical protein